MMISCCLARRPTSHFLRHCVSSSAGGAVSTAPHNEVPGPPCYPVFGTLLNMITDKVFDKEHPYLYFMKLFEVYGPVVKVKFPGQSTMILISRPEDAERVLQLTMDNPVRTPLEPLRRARYLNPYYEKKAGIVAENGEEWWRVRSRIQVPILKPKNVYNYLKDMDQVTLDFLDKISRSRNSDGEFTEDFREESTKWSLENICLVTFSQRVGSFDPSLSPDSESTLIRMAALDYMEAIFECETGSQLWKIFPTKAFKQLQNSMQKLTDTCEAVLENIEAGMQQRINQDSDYSLNMVEQLLCEPELTRKDIITFMVDLIPGGVETTATIGALSLYLLAKNPGVQTKVQEEVDRVLGSNSDNITPHQLAKLSYIKAVFKETNRLLPPFFGPLRILQKDIQIRDFTLQKGWTVFLMNSLAGWDETQFYRHKEFLPERWLRDRPYGQIHPCATAPFSFGVRMCAGRRLAEQEIYILLARTLQRFNVGWKGGELKRRYKFVFIPEGPFKFTFNERI